MADCQHDWKVFARVVGYRSYTEYTRCVYCGAMRSKRVSDEAESLEEDWRMEP